MILLPGKNNFAKRLTTRTLTHYKQDVGNDNSRHICWLIVIAVKK